MDASAGGYSPEGCQVVREGRHLTLVAWGAMVARCLQVAELAAEDGIDIEVLDLRWLKPIDAEALAASVRKTRRAVVVHEAPLTSGLGAEVAQLITAELLRHAQGAGGAGHRLRRPVPFRRPGRRIHPEH